MPEDSDSTDEIVTVDRQEWFRIQQELQYLRTEHRKSVIIWRLVRTQNWAALERLSTPRNPQHDQKDDIYETKGQPTTSVLDKTTSPAGTAITLPHPSHNSHSILVRPAAIRKQVAPSNMNLRSVSTSKNVTTAASMNSTSSVNTQLSNTPFSEDFSKSPSVSHHPRANSKPATYSRLPAIMSDEYSMQTHASVPSDSDSHSSCGDFHSVPWGIDTSRILPQSHQQDESCTSPLQTTTRSAWNNAGYQIPDVGTSVLRELPIRFTRETYQTMNGPRTLPPPDNDGQFVNDASHFANYAFKPRQYDPTINR